MKLRHAWIVVLAFLPWDGAGAQGREELIDRIGQEPGWAIESGPFDYAPADIEQVVEDDADRVREYGVVGVSRVDLSRTGDDDRVVVTLFEMVDPSAAFGLFALERNWQANDFERAVVGTESYRQGGRLFVWQANYVVVADGGPNAALELGALLTRSIIGSSRKAPVSTRLPRQGLITDSEQYLLSPEAFRQRTGLDPAELGFENSAEAAIAEYTSPAGGTAVLALLLYPTQHLASLHHDAWRGSVAEPPSSRRTGPLLGIAANGSDPALAQTVLDALSYQSEVTWNAPLPDPLTLPHLILTIFTWIGIALGFTAVAGLGFGGIRIYLKTRYPDRFLGVSPNAEFIQLRIDQSVTTKQIRE